MPPMIIFMDLKERDDAERHALAERLADLTRLSKQDGGLDPDLQAEFDDIDRRLGKPGEIFDSLFLELRDQLKRMTGDNVPDHVHGAFLTDNHQPRELTAAERRLVGVYGLLANDGQTVDSPRFVAAIADALGEYTTNIDLFDKSLGTLSSLGSAPTAGDPLFHGDGAPFGDVKEVRTYHRVRAEQWSGVVRVLATEGITSGDDHLSLHIQHALGSEVGIDEGAPRSSIEIDLPDLDAETDVEIIGNNVRAMQAIYFSAMLEEANFYLVPETILSQFQTGLLALVRNDDAGDKLYAYWKKSINRMAEIERRNLYARSFGFPGGDAAQVSPNREFSDLWLRFISAVSSYVRQISVDDLIRSTVPLAVSAEQVRKSGRDLAANLSLHGYGIAYFAATDLQEQINDIIALLSNAGIRGQYGARDLWGVIEQVSALELGGAKNTVRYRTMATAGAIIIRWLAERAPMLAGNFQTRPIIDLDQVRRGTRPKGVKATVKPTDRDLVDACEQWLAVTGTPDKSVEEYAQPIQAPVTTSRPIPIPQAARDLLDSVGVQTGYTPPAGNGSYASATRR